MKNGFNGPSTKWGDLCFAIVGLGLIGGSYAMALRQLGAKKIIGVERDAATIALAKERNIADVVLSNADETLREADVLICCIYPDAIAGFIKGNVGNLKENVLITDVAGIKRNMIEEVQAVLGPKMEFISGHPMAGRESNGLAMADAAIFQKANYIIVPSGDNTEEACCWLEALAMAFGCKHTVRVNAHEHDSIIAFTSNLPHVTAVALMDSESFNDKVQYFVAGSYRDGTRVANINPELWCDLFMANREKVAIEIDRYIDQLDAWRKALRSGDGEAMKEMMRTAAARRKELF